MRKAVLLTCVMALSILGSGRAVDAERNGEGNPKAKVNTQLLSAHETEAVFGGVEYYKCVYGTAGCPERCGDSGEYAIFKIVKYLKFEKPGKSSDGKAEERRVQIRDFHKKPKGDPKLGKTIRGLKKGDKVLLSWKHEYVTRTSVGGASSSQPERPITKLERITEGKAAIVKELSKTPTLNLGKKAWNGHPQIHRITTAAVFKRLSGGKDMPLDFDVNDLVIVRGSLGCAHGKVEFKTGKATATFSVRITERCNHETMQLHHFPYSGAFAVGKGTLIAPSVFVGPPKKWQEGNRAKKLANTGASGLNLTGYQITDDDLKKLREFNNLTHLYLSNNKITDKGLANLSHMTKLYGLYLGGNEGITDAGLEHLSPIMIGRIQILGIQNTHISQDGLATLRKWSKQQTNQYGTQINHSLVTPQVHR